MVLEELNLGFTLTTFLLGLCAIILFYRYSIRNYDYFEKRGIPFAKPSPFVGSVFQNIGKPIYELEQIRYKELGPIYGHFEGNTPLLSVGKPELLRDILVKDFQFFPARRDFRTGDKMFDSMLSVVQGEDWKRIRAIVTPTFSTGKIKRMMGIFEDCAKTLVRNFNEEMRKGQDVEIKRVFGGFTMDVIASCAFSTKIDSHNDPDNAFVRRAQQTLGTSLNWRLIFFLIAPKLMKLLKIPLMDRNNLDFFKDATIQIINERKRTGQKRNDFLQLLLDSAEEMSSKQKLDGDRKELDILTNYGVEPTTEHQIFHGVNFGKKYLSMDELVSQCIVFFIAGFDTTSSVLTFCSYELALHQDVQEKLKEEVDRVIEKHGGKLTYEGIQQMKYLDNIMSETLRIHSPAIRLERVAEMDYELGDTGITVPKGMIVTVPVFAMHRDPGTFPDPERFDPDRFSPEEKGMRKQYSYLPFGAGPLNCVAMRFALIEVKVCLAYVAAHFTIQRSAKTKVPMDFYIRNGSILQPKEVHVTFELRDNCLLKM